MLHHKRQNRFSRFCLFEFPFLYAADKNFLFITAAITKTGGTQSQNICSIRSLKKIGTKIISRIMFNTNTPAIRFSQRLCLLSLKADTINNICTKTLNSIKTALKGVSKNNAISLHFIIISLDFMTL